MKRTRLLATFVAVAMMLLFVVPAANAAPPTQNLLSGIPVTGTLDDGGTFEGTLTITDVGIVDGQFVVSGTLEGTATQNGTVTEITQTFTNVVADLLSGGEQRCDILFLDIGPIFLDLLGLQVDLSQITLDVDAVPGSGNLLGNLLCAVAGLLDNNGPVDGLLRLVNRLLG